jgi:hypothetical protein
MAVKNRSLRENAVRVGDYLFGRNTLIGVASLMMLAISGYATWSGMSDFIVGLSSSGEAGREIVGGLSVTNEALVIAIVVTLTFLMWLALRETFGRNRFSSARGSSHLRFMFFWHSGRWALVMDFGGA